MTAVMPNAVAAPAPSIELPRPQLSWAVSLEAWVVLLLFQGLRGLDGLALTRAEAPTMLVWAASVISALLAFVSVRYVSRRSVRILNTCLALAVLATVSLLWSPSVAYGPLKAFLFAVLNTWLLALGAFVIGPDPARLIRLMIFLFLAASGLVAAVAFSGSTSGGGAASVAGIEYGIVGAVVAIGTLLGLAFLVMGHASTPVRLSVACLTAAMCYTLVVGGQRQALLGVVSVALFYAFASGKGRGWTRRRHPVLRFVAVAAALVGALFLTVDPGSSSTLVRLEILRAGPQADYSTNVRLTRYEAAPDMWREAPVLGNGLGSWPIMAGFGDAREYPHNGPIEVAVELGAAGVVLLLLLIGQAFVALGPWRQLRTDPLGMTVLVVMVYLLLTSQFGGDLVDNRALFLMMGLAAATDVRRRRSRVVN